MYKTMEEIKEHGHDLTDLLRNYENISAIWLDDENGAYIIRFKERPLFWETADIVNEFDFKMFVSIYSVDMEENELTIYFT